MKLSNNQIQELYSLTQNKKVIWYDLQSELVDHLANDIEQIWQTEPDLTFEEVKQQAFNKFGKKGFENIVNIKKKVLTKFYHQLFWEQLKIFFTIPKIIITISLFLAVLFITKLVNHHFIFVFSLPMLILIVFLVYSFKNYNQVKRKDKQFLFENIMINLGNFVMFLNAPFQILATYIIINKNIWSFQMEIIYALTIVIMSIVYYILIFELPSKIRAIIAKEHPEYQLS